MATTWPQQRFLNPIGDLDLDAHNPRLRADEEGSSQEQLIEIFTQRFKLEEIADSIVASGFLTFDPMIAAMEGDRVVILEGNRRLAALKLLLDPDLAPPRVRDRWQRLSESLSADARQRIQEIPVLVFARREEPDLQSYIGFRHVTGVLQWPALEKASYIALLIERGATYQDVADRLGSYPAVVRRHYVAYRTVIQAQEWEMPGAEQAASAFGVLLRSLQAEGVLQFLGIGAIEDPNEARFPVPADHREDLADFIRWTFGTDDTRRVLPESRDLTRLGKILQSREAVRYLRLTEAPDFERAWAKAGGEVESLADSLWAASYRLEESVPLVPQYRQDRNVSDAVGRVARFFALIAAQIPDVVAAHGLELVDARTAEH